MSDAGRTPRIALTMGDIAGIGPEIVARVVTAMKDQWGGRIVLVDDHAVLILAARMLGLRQGVIQMLEHQHDDAVIEYVDLHHGVSDLLALGQPNKRTGEASVYALLTAIKMALQGEVDAVVFAPLCKESLAYQGQDFDDELDLFRQISGFSSVARIVKAGTVFTTSVTSHVPLRVVPSLITLQRVLDSITLLHYGISAYESIRPRLAVGGLNPHGGEHGRFGTEEIEHIDPAVDIARQRGFDVTGPLPADTVFLRAFKGEFDGVVGMYHDQANIATKIAHFGQTIVLYVGSPILMMTPGHGTAFDIAGKGIADSAGLGRTIDFALKTVKQRRAHGNL